MGLIDSLKAYNEKGKTAVRALAESELEMLNENKIEEREGVDKITAPLIAFANQKPERGSVQEKLLRAANERQMEVVQGRVLGAEQLTELRRVMEEIASASAAPSPPGEVLLDYEQFIKISTICQASWECCDAPADPEIVNQLFQASTFLGFKSDHLGRISAKNFYEYVVRRNDMLKLRLELEEYDSDHDGVITESQLQSFIDDQLGDAAQTMEQLRAGGWDLREKYVQIALRKFLFFHGSKGRSRSAEQRILLVDLLASPVLEEFLDVHLPPDEAMHPSNWFSPRRVSKLVHRFGELDADGDGALTPAELRRFRTMYSGGEIAPSLTEVFVERVFEEHVFGGGKKTRRSFLSTMSFSDYIDFELAWEYHTSPAGIAYFFRVLDVHHAGYITRQEIYTFFRDVYELWLGMELWDFNVHDVANEIFDMAAPGTPGRITLQDLCDCQLGGTICVMLVDVMCFYDYDQRESQSSSPSESDD